MAQVPSTFTCHKCRKTFLITEAAYSFGNGPPAECKKCFSSVSEIDHLQAENERLREELETLNKVCEDLSAQKLTGGHDVPCYYCGEPCDSLSINPAKWPVPLGHPKGAGKTYWHHRRCVEERIEELASRQYARIMDEDLMARYESRIDELEALLSSGILLRRHTAEEIPKKPGRYLCDIKYHQPYKYDEKKMTWRLWSRKSGGHWVKNSAWFDVIAWYEEK